MKHLFLALLLISLSVCASDEMGTRIEFWSSPNSNPFDISFGGTTNPSNKLIEVFDKYTPFHQENVYVEGALGGEANVDFGTTYFPLMELSLGLQIKVSDFRIYISDGPGLFPSGTGYPGLEFATHYGIQVVEGRWWLGVEQTHYSNGSTDGHTLGINFNGFTLGVKL